MIPHTIKRIFHDLHELELHANFDHDKMANLVKYNLTSVHQYKQFKSDFDVRLGKYEIRVTPFTFKVSEILVEKPSSHAIDYNASFASVMLQNSQVRDRWIFEINNNKSICYYNENYKYQQHSFCTTEEEYFQQSTVEDFGSFTFEDMKYISEFMQCITNEIQKFLNRGE